MDALLNGTRVFPVVLGTVGFGSTIAQDDAQRLMDAYALSGGSMIDTANIYGFTPEERSRSEKSVAKWLRESGAKNMLLATKGAHPRDDAEGSRVRPEYIEMDCQESADIFQRPIDLYWLHRDDPSYPVKEIMDALFQQMDLGRILSIGASNWSPARIAEANAYAAAAGRPGFAGSQIQYALCMPQFVKDPTLVQLDEAADGPFYTETQLPVYAFTAQSKGYVAKAISGQRLETVSAYDTPENRRKAAAVKQISDTLQESPNAVALAYLFHQPYPCLAIIGPKNMEQLNDSLRAASIRLTDAQVSAIRGA